jgi:hypothetical protein
LALRLPCDWKAAPTVLSYGGVGKIPGRLSPTVNVWASFRDWTDLLEVPPSSANMDLPLGTDKALGDEGKKTRLHTGWLSTSATLLA